jgi:UDP-N-acetylglucosamine 1-carboxyvinyltransferase
VAKLTGTRHDVIADRIEAGTFCIAVAATGGNVFVDGARAEDLGALIDCLQQAGVTVEVEAKGLRIKRDPSKPIKPVDVQTQPHPGFPTDLQAQFMALMCIADGTSTIRENIFENRFMHAPELSRLGANITVRGNEAIVKGVPKLRAAPVMATDLRASVSLVIAALVAEGETTVNRIYHLDRGFERLEEKLGRCGAKITRQEGSA